MLFAYTRFRFKTFSSPKRIKLNIFGFTASHHWLLNFESRHHVSSRKVTKLVAKNPLEDRDKILKSAENFVKEVINVIPDYAEDHILNSD